MNPLHDKMVVPAMQIPSYRTNLALERGVEKNLLLRTWGGLGDQICAEPTLRYALEHFKDCNITLASEEPDLFRHLDFFDVINLKKGEPVDESKYFVFNTIVDPTQMVWEFMSHMITHCVDFPSLCAFRAQLPVAYRAVRLVPREEDVTAAKRYLSLLDGHRFVVVHAGKHWQSKTFPKWWWDEVLHVLRLEGISPVLIGANRDDNRATVDVDTTGCLDLRNQTSIMETVALLKESRVLLTNDSSPMHMAADSNAWIGFVATVKKADYITHWRISPDVRGPVWGWRMQDFAKGCGSDLFDYCPNKKQEITIEDIGEENLLSFLPDPRDFAKWGAHRAVLG